MSELFDLALQAVRFSSSRTSSRKSFPSAVSVTPRGLRRRRAGLSLKSVRAEGSFWSPVQTTRHTEQSCYWKTTSHRSRCRSRVVK